MQRSAGKIASALIECLKTKPVMKVNVAELALAAGVSRATFYRIFDTPVDVLVYICDSFSAEMMQSLSKAPFVDRQAFSLPSSQMLIIQFMMSRFDVLDAVFRSGRPDVLQRSLEPQAELLFADSGIMINDWEKDYFRHSLAAVLISILYVWDQHGRKESAEDLQEMYHRFLFRGVRADVH